MRRLAATGLALLVAPGGVSGQQLDEAEAAVLPRVLSALPVEISADHIGEERAVLLESAGPDAGFADLVILAGAPDDRAGQTIAVARDLVWAGAMAGQVPWLEVAGNGSLLVHSEQIAIGRSPWEETLTLAEREGQIRVAGYTLNQWDRFTAGTARCDWNLLTGKWLSESEVEPEDGPPRRQRREGRLPRIVSVSDWKSETDSFPDFCRADLSAE